MNLKKRKRFTIIGLPGSGKSTFSMKLGKILNIPVHHLDKHMFESGGKKRDKEEFLSIQREMISEKSWIIEGCSMSTLEMRFIETDILIYFHFSRLLCIWRAIKRSLTQDKNLAETGCADVINWRLLRYIWIFDKEKGIRILKLKKKYPKVEFYIFRKPQDVSRFLKKVKLKEKG